MLQLHVVLGFLQKVHPLGLSCHLQYLTVLVVCELTRCSPSRENLKKKKKQSKISKPLDLAPNKIYQSKLNFF